MVWGSSVKRRVLPWPLVAPGNFESEMPGAGVLALTLGSGAHPVPVRLSILPPPAVGAAVVKVKSAPGGTVHDRSRTLCRVRNGSFFEFAPKNSGAACLF